MQPKQPSDDLSVTNLARGSGANSRAADRDVAARITRQQIDRIYDQSQTPAPQPETTDSPYRRVHDDYKAHQAAAPENEWQRYHTAWQQYYQQYYERYYLQQIHRHKQVAPASTISAGDDAFPLEDSDPRVAAAEEEISKDKAVIDIRHELLDKIKHHSDKVRSNKHFWPIASALVVMLVFASLQYNRLVIANVKAYISPGAISPQNIILDPTTAIAVGPESKLIIPKINVETPVIYSVNTLSEGPIQTALQDGVVHYPIPGANSLPGEKGNNVILGHSSNDVFDNGGYKFIFVQLDHLQKGDLFYLHHGGLRYTYSITGKEIINPDQIEKLILPADKPTATLVTCTPPGTALKRLVVYAEQISPDPNSATASSQAGSSTPQTTQLPGNSPTLFQRLFGN